MGRYAYGGRRTCESCNSLDVRELQRAGLLWPRRRSTMTWTHREKPMRIRQIVVLALFAAGLAAVPIATAKAQYYYPPCSPFPLSWPFCVAGAVVGTAATIVTAPFVALAGPSYYYYGYYGWPRHHYARRHYAHYYYGPR